MIKLWDKVTGEVGNYDAIDVREILRTSPDRYTKDDPQLAPPPPAPSAPPASPAPPVLNIPPDWRKGSAAEVKVLAERISGRTPDNREQAVAVIEAALIPPPPV